jgi:hypothetical protein
MTTIPTKLFAACALLAPGLLLGCHKAAPPPAVAGAPAATAPGAPVAGSASHVDGTPHTDAVENALRDAGLTPEGFAPLVPVPYGAATCDEGRVQGLDTVVCEYRDQTALTKGQATLLEQWGREGGHTGVAYHQKLTMIAVVDRARHDPNGKVIQRVIETFRKI